jgi:hypothetical protein
MPETTLNQRWVALKIDADQTRAARERPAPDGGHAVGDRDARQVRADIERLVPNARHGHFAQTIRDHHRATWTRVTREHGAGAVPAKGKVSFLVGPHRRGQERQQHEHSGQAALSCEVKRFHVFS